MPKLPEALARFGGLAFQMAVPIGVGAWIGRLLDARWAMAQPWCTIAGLLVGLTVAMLMVWSRFRS
jgi:F0F1-type ATP synthase assembly protein I